MFFCCISRLSVKRDHHVRASVAVSLLCHHMYLIPLFILLLSVIACCVASLIAPGRQHYRLYTIKNVPSLKTLDYQKISKTERDRAERLAKSAAGAALEADVQGEEPSTTSKTFIPGEGLSAEASFTTSFTSEEKEQIRALVANASNPAEIEEIEQSVQRGILPPQLLQQRKRAAENGDVVSDPPTKKSRVDSES